MEIICLLLLCRQRPWRWWQRSDKWLNIIAQWAATAPVNLSRAEGFGWNIFIRRRWITINKKNTFYVLNYIPTLVHKQSQEPQSIKKGEHGWWPERLWCCQLYANAVSSCHTNAYVTMSLLFNQRLPQIQYIPSTRHVGTGHRAWLTELYIYLKIPSHVQGEGNVWILA